MSIGGPHEVLPPHGSGESSWSAWSTTPAPAATSSGARARAAPSARSSARSSATSHGSSIATSRAPNRSLDRR